MPSSYYQSKKHLYKARYEEKKVKDFMNYEIYASYGGEKEYYKSKLIEWGLRTLPPQSITTSTTTADGN